MKKDTIAVFTDGSSRGNPGPGGWGAVIISRVGSQNSDQDSAKVWELGGREDRTTNNRMEMSAALSALAFIEKRNIPGSIEMHTDSSYLLQGVTGWMHGWEKNGWKTKTGEPVLNQDLWKELGSAVFRLKQKREIAWTKVSGHVGLLGNERADMIATNAADKTAQILFTGGLDDYEKLIGGSVFEGETDEKVAKKKNDSSRKGLAYSYVSSIAGAALAHKTWPECEARVRGKPNARYRKVFSKEEEASLLKEWTYQAAS